MLIPETQNANTIGHFRHISLANFKPKIISKILDNRLASVMPHIVSSEDKGSIKGRSIEDCVCLTSEAINTLNRKCYGGNVALKIDIAKVFDTFNWKFLLQILKRFGLCSKFCNWIHNMLQPAH